MQKSESSVNLRVICRNAPSGSEIEFGLQEDKDTLHPGSRQADGSLVFTCSVRVQTNAATYQPNFLGSFAHGTPQQRFLYLSLRQRTGEPTAWIRRVKIQLGSITWAQIEQAEKDGWLEAAVDGAKSGSAALVESWRFVRK